MTRFLSMPAVQPPHLACARNKRSPTSSSLTLIWSISRKHKKVSAIVLEASFPNRLQELADVSRHLTPQTLEREIDKLGMNSVPVLVTHLKPEYRGEIIADLRSLEKRHLKVLKDGDVLRF